MTTSPIEGETQIQVKTAKTLTKLPAFMHMQLLATSEATRRSDVAELRGDGAFLLSAPCSVASLQEPISEGQTSSRERFGWQVRTCITRKRLFWSALAEPLLLPMRNQYDPICISTSLTTKAAKDVKSLMLFVVQLAFSWRVFVATSGVTDQLVMMHSPASERREGSQNVFNEHKDYDLPLLLR
eukprot:TRINITY_DN49185_c0_g1_i1.p1 TRINITY_DN49185_c0_g1~~TRINITY_DN49185_c0_g1_i1.p1  ORF type:complete len:184 (-),score=21.71 TRINITY_DN49185_c0_g1_i1:161-712(-)